MWTAGVILAEMSANEKQQDGESDAEKRIESLITHITNEKMKDVIKLMLKDDP